MAVTGSGGFSSSSSIYEWEIENYSSYNEMAVGKPLYSPSFNIHNILWNLVLYTGGEREESQGFLSLYLSLDKDKVPAGVEIHAHYALAFIDNRRKVIAKFNPNCASTFNDSIRAWGRSKLVNKSSVTTNTNVTLSNKIIIVCEVVVKEIKSYKALLTIGPDRIQHFKNFQNLFNNPKLSDVKFMVQEKEIFAHKMILATNSVVFDAMFEHKMRESEENIVKVEDISYNVFSELLRFMYTGECTLTDDIVNDLFEAADKYQISNLKNICEEELFKNISVTNVIAILQLADMHSAERLKKEAIEFIALNGKDIIDKPEFDAIGSLNTKLLKDVFRGIFTR